jgi:hypothetical protein
MKRTRKRLFTIGIPVFAVGVVLLGEALLFSGCDNWNSYVACRSYCSKHFEYSDKAPTGNETDTCVSDCQDSIDNNCGAEHQAAVNETIGKCTEKSCGELAACMVFDAAPDFWAFSAARRVWHQILR